MLMAAFNTDDLPVRDDPPPRREVTVLQPRPCIQVGTAREAEADRSRVRPISRSKAGAPVEDREPWPILDLDLDDGAPADPWPTLEMDRPPCPEPADLPSVEVELPVELSGDAPLPSESAELPAARSAVTLPSVEVELPAELSAEPVPVGPAGPSDSSEISVVASFELPRGAHPEPLTVMDVPLPPEWDDDFPVDIDIDVSDLVEPLATALGDPDDAPAGGFSLSQLEVSVAPQSDSNFFEDLDGHLGVFLATYEQLAPGTRVWLTVHMPGPYSFEALARVDLSRSEASGDWPGLVLRFLSIEADAYARVCAFIRARQPLFY